MAQLNFNATEVEPSDGMLAVPTGWYNVMIDESEIIDAKNFDITGNRYLQLRFVIVDGEYKGRKLWSRLNIENSNPVAKEIAYQQLSAIAHAVGVLIVEHSEQLHDIPLKIRAKYKAETAEYDAGNDITAYKNINEATDPLGKITTTAAKTATAKPTFKPTPPAAMAKKPEPVKTEPVYRMTETADFTREEYHDADWSDDDLITAGYMIIEEPEAKAPAKPSGPPKKPTAPTKPAVKEAESTGKVAPPWSKKKAA